LDSLEDVGVPCIAAKWVVVHLNFLRIG